jgi:hypothetical protein
MVGPVRPLLCQKILQSVHVGRPMMDFKCSKSRLVWVQAKAHCDVDAGLCLCETARITRSWTKQWYFEMQVNANENLWERHGPLGVLH